MALTKVAGRIIDGAHLTIRDLHNIKVDQTTDVMFGSYMGLRLHFHNAVQHGHTARQVIEVWSAPRLRGEARLFNLPIPCWRFGECPVNPKDPQDQEEEPPKTKKTSHPVNRMGYHPMETLDARVMEDLDAAIRRNRRPR
jgi:hypothetical protein